MPLYLLSLYPVQGFRVTFTLICSSSGYSFSTRELHMCWISYIYIYICTTVPAQMSLDSFAIHMQHKWLEEMAVDARHDLQTKTLTSSSCSLVFIHSKVFFLGVALPSPPAPRHTFCCWILQFFSPPLLAVAVSRSGDIRK